MDMNFFVLGYLDAGTGSLIFQVLVASLVSVGVIFGGVMTQLRSFFSRFVLRRRSEPSASESPLASDKPVIALHDEQTLESASHRKAA